jgi:tungstate transport system permease protein
MFGHVELENNFTARQFGTSHAMDYFAEGIAGAIRAMVGPDPAIRSAALRSVWISSLAVLLASVCGLPIGCWLARARFTGRRYLVVLFRAGMAFPTVFVGIVCFGLFARRGPLGPLELLYTPWAIVLGEFMLAFPIVVSLTHGAVHALDPRVSETAWTLGASSWHRWKTYVSEARTGVTLAIIVAFSRCVTELGIAMMVGGNLKDRTRTLATATAMETSKGEFAQGLAMGLVLLSIALVAVALMGRLNREDKL